MEGIAAAIVAQPFVQVAARQLEKALDPLDVYPCPSDTDLPEKRVKAVAVAVTEADKAFLENKKDARSKETPMVYTSEQMDDNARRHQRNKDLALQTQVRGLLDRIAK